MLKKNESCHQNATCDGCSRGTHAIKEGLLVQAKMYGKHNYEQKFYSINDMMQHHALTRQNLFFIWEEEGTG